MLISFIIPTLNSEKTLKDTILSILETTKDIDFELIIVDHGSNDQTQNIAQYFNAIWIENSNKSIASSRNLGAKTATGKYLTFIDSDVILEADWAEKSLRLMEDKELDLLQGRLIPKLNDSFVSKYRFHTRNVQTKGTFNLLSNMILNPDGATINTACFICRRSTFEKVNGFNERIMNYEGHDLYLKYRKHKYKMIPTLNTSATVSWNHKELTLLSFMHYLMKKGAHLAALHYELGLHYGHRGIFYLDLKSYPFKFKWIRVLIAIGTYAYYQQQKFLLMPVKKRVRSICYTFFPVMICAFQLFQRYLPSEVYPFSKANFYTRMNQYPKITVTLNLNKQSMNAFHLIPMGWGYTLWEYMLYGDLKSEEVKWASKKLIELIPVEYKSRGSSVKFCAQHWKEFHWQNYNNPDEEQCFYEQNF